VRWRKAADLPPAGQRIDSPYGPGAKRRTTWTGYKGHLTEACEDDEAHLVTNAATTPAVAADVDVTAPMHAALAARGLLPGDHLVDAGFVDVELLVSSRVEQTVRLVGPACPDVSWQAPAGQGYDIAHFTIDWEARRVTCPEGRTSAVWTPGRDRWGNEVIHAEFARRECLAFRSRPLCTRPGRSGCAMTLRCTRRCRRPVGGRRRRTGRPSMRDVRGSRGPSRRAYEGSACIVAAKWGWPRRICSM
jgi:transposase